MSDRTHSWWSLSTRHSRRTAVGALVLAGVLATVSGIVWASPAATTDRVSRALTALAAEEHSDPVAAKNAQLRAQVDELETKLAASWHTIAKIKSASVAAQASSATKLAVASKAAAEAQASLASVKAQLAALPATRTTTAVKAPATHAVTTPAGDVITAPTKAALLNPQKRYFGMYTEQSPFNWATFDSTAQKIGVAPGVAGYFSGWDESFRANAVTRSWQKGVMPFMTWESRPINDGNDVINAPDYSLHNIIGGNFDAYLHQYAKDIVATDLPLAIRLDQEMNGVWYPWAETDGAGASINGNSPGEFATMWQHVHDIFQQEGANDLVIWVWSPNIVNNLPKSHQSVAYTASLYPGDEYVDWTGVSAYLRPPYKDDQTFTFDYTFQKTLAQLRTIGVGKPIMLSEIGASEIGGHKAAWVADLFDGLSRPENSDVIGFSWFDLAVTSYVEGERATNDWRIDSRSDSLAAFIAGITRADADFDLRPAS